MVAEPEQERVHSLRRLPGERRQVESQRLMLREQAARRSTRMRAEPCSKGLQGKERLGLTTRVKFGPEAAMPGPELMACSCSLCSKGERQEAEGRRRV